jgi:hypothetical protein
VYRITSVLYFKPANEIAARWAEVGEKSADTYTLCRIASHKQLTRSMARWAVVGEKRAN